RLRRSAFSVSSIQCQLREQVTPKSKNSKRKPSCSYQLIIPPPSPCLSARKLECNASTRPPRRLALARRSRPTACPSSPQAHIHRELDYLSRLLTLHLFAIADPYCPTPSYQCQNCRKEIVNTNKLQLEVHAETHDAKNWPKEKCWPNDFQ
ncbi:hypothetical protein PG990_009101, partial [Apiospora arundinis]